MSRYANWNDLDAYLIDRGVRIGEPTLGQTTGGVHTSGSRHYMPPGLGRDYGRTSDRAAVLAALLPLAVGPDPALVELFYGTTFVKNGAEITPSAGLRSAHQGHVHAGIATGVTVDELRPNGVIIPGDPSDVIPGALIPGGDRPDILGLDGIAAAAQSVGRVLGALDDRTTWVRVAQVAGGGALVLAGVYALANDLSPVDLIPGAPA